MKEILENISNHKKERMKKKTKKLKTRIAIILDRSSSMMSIRTEAIP